MSYDFHIENTGKSLEEWTSFAKNHPLLIVEDEARGENPKTGEVIQISMPNGARGPQGLWLVPREGEEEVSITIYSPQEKDMPFMKQIATEFGGDLVGDEGESY